MFFLLDKMAKYSGKKHGVEVYDKTSINVTGEGPLGMDSVEL